MSSIDLSSCHLLILWNYTFKNAFQRTKEERLLEVRGDDASVLEVRAHLGAQQPQHVKGQRGRLARSNANGAEGTSSIELCERGREGNGEKSAKCEGEREAETNQQAQGEAGKWSARKCPPCSSWRAWSWRWQSHQTCAWCPACAQTP